MKLLTQDELKSMSREDIETELSNKIYQASKLLEQLEDAGRIAGNGHHLRQEACKLVIDLMRRRWIIQDK